MTFRFRSNKTASPSSNSGGVGSLSGIKQLSHIAAQNVIEKGDPDDFISPKLTNAQINNLTKVYPAWLKDGSSLKRLPGVYQGVLGQVQLQPNLVGVDMSKGSQFGNGNKQKLQSTFNVMKQQSQQLDYMNRFTDTERVQQLLSASQLSNESLATIWAHVNKTFPGKLTNREVCLALALIAIFQRLEKSDSSSSLCTVKSDSDRDPFNLVKVEKKPPVPILYPNHHQRTGDKTNSSNIFGNNNNANNIQQPLGKTNALSSSTKTVNDEILVDLWVTGDEEEKQNETLQHQKLSSSKSEQCLTRRPLSCSTSLIDSDGDRFENDFLILKQTWLRYLKAMKGIFKRSFDILNVENSRQSAIEALRSYRGQQFSKQLSLCYPIAHNIKYKIDELNSIRISGRRIISYNTPATDTRTIIDTGDDIKKEPLPCLFDKNYIEQIDDLMTSINEYWAVLINLFHESGQTKFIELIMDGLNYNQQTVFSQTIDELINELDGLGKSNVCSLCHTNFYLKPTNDDPLSRGLSMEDAELVADDSTELISIDKEHYYHAKCANFWLNQVDPTGLPFHSQSLVDAGILSPVKK